MDFVPVVRDLSHGLEEELEKTYSSVFSALTLQEGIIYFSEISDSDVVFFSFCLMLLRKVLRGKQQI